MTGRHLTALIALLLTALLAAACSSSDQTGGEDGAAAAAATSTPVPTAALSARPTYTVERGTVEDVYTFTGRWQPRDQMSLSFPTNGTIRQVNVRAGDAVSAGDLLADYDTSDLENQLASAELNLESALSNIDTSATGSVESVENAQFSLANANLSLESQKNNSPWTSVASAKLSLESAQRSLEDAERAYREALSYPENPASTVDNAYQQVLSAQQQLKNAQISYSSAAQSYSNYEIQLQQQENSVLQAELTLQRAIADASAGVSDESVRSAQLNIDQINEDIANASLYAPIDGVVLQVNIATGDSATAYSTVIVIGLPEPKEVIASLALTDANNLAVGMTGACQVMNQPDTAVGCAVRRIPLNSSDSDQTTRVAASLEGVADNQLIEVDIPLEVREDVLWLPPSVIRTFQNRTFVVLQTADGPQTVDVELGLQTDDRVEIVSGVQEGDVVVAP
ncbi:efflux RND transporter periplasmic adaptor subunit [Aggregatilinea lenta]|uniref:efflux RND transporter periplasmic adaptor subunit n=1 Tax=Aggregatilinea lenta TaxID=913108 RepID=UPI0013C32CB8|nr:biotin/lipoyl-binding protein [Aggregatilinea lenta]